MSDTPGFAAEFEGPRVVGIGASAGGLDALEKFFTHLPLDTGLAYVVVQHTSAGHTTLLGALLQSVTSLPIHEAQNGVVLAANAVYVMPTSGELTVVRGCLHFSPTPKDSSAHLPIDAFLNSLAVDQGHRCVGVILSGMGRDGVQGLQAIHAAQGLCLAQAPDTAAYASMPQSAIESGGVDGVCTPEDMPLKIKQWAAQAEAPASRAATGTALVSIVNLMRQHLQHDFSLYKPSTLHRRIERRMHIHHVPNMQAYAHYLQNNPAELAVLFSELLIGVTSFFRDPLVWLDLSTQVLPPLFAATAEATAATTVRAWVLGCSSGEEAYSLAMALQEAQDADTVHPRAVHIYATDLNPNAIAVARKGWYSAQAVQALSEERRARFFTPAQGGFKVTPAIRAMVMFARHDVITDPPFTQLDLLFCRNVLIYFNASLQKRLMALFHFGLRASGTLVLGSAETVGRNQALFTALKPISRIYARNDLRLTASSAPFSLLRRTVNPVSELQLPMSSNPPQTADNLQSLADQVLLQAFSPAAVLVNAEGDILYTSGQTAPYLEAASGKANWNIHAMAKPELREPIATALRQALQGGVPVVLGGLVLQGDTDRQLQLTVHPLHVPAALADTAMLVFKELVVTTLGQDPEALSIHEASESLLSTRATLHSLRRETQVSKDQLTAINASLQISNDELQTANEELTTSKEEAQSMNEELQTINNELQTHLDDLALAQSDMQNLLNSTDIATLFLDIDLNVRRFTERAVSIFHLREVDVGRPLSDLANTLVYPLLQADVKETLRTLTPSTKSVEATDGRWFSVQIMPYRTLANTVNGAVLTFVDISTAKALEFRLRETSAPTPPTGNTP